MAVVSVIMAIFICLIDVAWLKNFLKQILFFQFCWDKALRKLTALKRSKAKRYRDGLQADI